MWQDTVVQGVSPLISTMTHTDWLAFALAALTTVYTCATLLILRANKAVVRAMREQIEAHLRPYVMVTVFPRMGSKSLCLLIKNVGKSPANDLHLEMDQDFYLNAERVPHRNVRALSAFTKPIASLPPDAQLVFDLGTGPEIFSATDPTTCPLVFTVQAKYRFSGQSFDEDTTVDFHPFLMTSVPNDPVAEAIDRLRKSVEEFVKK